MSEQFIHPDAVFGSGKSKGALISGEIAELAASLEVPAVGGMYEPDAFVRAIKARHDTLVEVTARLKKQNEWQVKREAELRKREEAVHLREKRVAAAEALTSGGKRSWWRL